MGDYVILLQAGVSGSTVFHNLSDVDTLHRSEVYLVALFFLRVHIDVHVRTLDADHGTLHITVLLDIIDHLVHNRSGDGEAITDVRTCL